MAIVTPGTDFAKNVFALHGVDATGQSELVRLPSRARRQELMASLRVAADVAATRSGKRPSMSQPARARLCAARMKAV